MKNATFLALTIAVIVLVLAMISMHRPRSAASTRSLTLHGGR